MLSLQENRPDELNEYVQDIFSDLEPYLNPNKFIKNANENERMIVSKVVKFLGKMGSKSTNIVVDDKLELSNQLILENLNYNLFFSDESKVQLSLETILPTIKSLSISSNQTFKIASAECLHSIIIYTV